MLITTPAHVLAVVVLQMPGVDVLAWLLMTVGFGYCAAAIIKAPDDAWILGRLTAPRTF